MQTQSAPRMTRARMNRDAVWERLREMTEHNLYLARNRAKGPLVVRMDEVQLGGRFDRDENGFNRTYRGPVGGEAMVAQVVVLGSDMVICFWSAVRDHSRRFLVVSGDGASPPTYWMETESRAVQCGPRSKYYDAIKRIVCLHLHYGDTVSLTAEGAAALAAREGEAA